MALGRARRDRRAVPVIVEKMRLLTAEDDFSHHRAVSLALEMLGDPGAARPLADVLTQPAIAATCTTRSKRPFAATRRPRAAPTK